LVAAITGEVHPGGGRGRPIVRLGVEVNAASSVGERAHDDVAFSRLMIIRSSFSADPATGDGHRRRIDHGTLSHDRRTSGDPPMSTAGELTVSVFARADTPTPERRRDVCERLEELVAEGAIADYTYRTWPHLVSVDDEYGGEEVVETFYRFTEWAEAAGVRIDPPWSVKSYHCQFTGERDVRIHVPFLVLAVMSEEGVECVYPYHDDERTIGVEEGLDALAEEPRNEPDDRHTERDTREVTQ
jgi:hypothetical protein